MKLAHLVAQYAAFRKNLGVRFRKCYQGPADRFLAACGSEAGHRRRASGSSKGLSRWARPSHALLAHEAYDPSWLLPLRSEPRPHCRVAVACDNPEEPERFVAYIYSHDELQRLLDGTWKAHRASENRVL